MSADFLYDAFISYNQKLDKPFVRRLQKQLQNLGKAWWQRRAVRIFRDETSLSATPEMWPAIERALAKSRYLVVCASPEAAASHWVNEEVRWWIAHKSADTLLIALTAGELHWDRAGNNFAWNDATPLPPAFKGAFATEPKWTDFRAYRALADGDRAETLFSGLLRTSPPPSAACRRRICCRRRFGSSAAPCARPMAAPGDLAVIAAVAASLGYLAYERGVETRQQRDAALLNQSQFLTDLSGRATGCKRRGHCSFADARSTSGQSKR